MDGLKTYAKGDNQQATKKNLYSIQREAERFRGEVEIPNPYTAANGRVTKLVVRVKQKAKQQAQYIEERTTQKKNYIEKELHGS